MEEIFKHPEAAFILRILKLSDEAGELRTPERRNNFIERLHEMDLVDLEFTLRKMQKRLAEDPRRHVEDGGFKQLMES